MKLSEEQLNTVERVLTSLGVTFEDYKIEITDHIACEVEELCENENINFDRAFETVLKKWNRQLVRRGSFWFSQLYSFPKFITDDVAKRARKQQLIYIFPFIIFIFCIYFDFDRKLLDENTSLLKTIYFSVFGLLSIFAVRMNYKPIKTSHRFLFNQSFVLFLIYATAFLITDKADFLLLFYLIWILTASPAMVKNAMRHERFMQRLKHS